jgi:hypothetical protein
MLRDFGGVRVVEWLDPITGTGDALALVAACFEHDARAVLLEDHVLPPAFFELRTGFAGEFLQKLENYQIRLAAVFPSERAYAERFREFLAEARNGRRFRSFERRAEAESWLAGAS